MNATATHPHTCDLRTDGAGSVYHTTRAACPGCTAQPQTRVATVADEFDHPLTETEHFQIGLLARETPGQVDRVLLTNGQRITGGDLIDTDHDRVLHFTITGLGVYADPAGWQPLPTDDDDQEA